MPRLRELLVMAATMADIGPHLAMLDKRAANGHRTPGTFIVDQEDLQRYNPDGAESKL